MVQGGIMELYYKDKGGTFVSIKDLKDGIWRIAEMPKYDDVVEGKEYSFLREADLPKAMTIASFYPYEYEIAKRLLIYISNIEDDIEPGPVSIQQILNIIKEVIIGGK